MLNNFYDELYAHKKNGKKLISNKSLIQNLRQIIDHLFNIAMCSNIPYGKFFLILIERDVVLRCCFNVLCGIKMWKIHDSDMQVYGSNVDF